MVTMVNPQALTFREDDQINLEGVRNEFSGDEYTPIVVIREDDSSLTILDGHNRATVAAERGHQLSAVEVSRRAIDALHEAGYCDLEIAYAALVEAGEYDQANNINLQFPGAGIAERGEDAAAMLATLG